MIMLSYELDERFTVISESLMTVFASDLGLPPGQWPKQFELRTNNQGTFAYDCDGVHQNKEGETISVSYRVSNRTHTVKVYND